MTQTKRTITLNDIEALRITFNILGREHDYNPDPEKRDYTRGIVSDVNAEWGSGRWFAFWICDCFDPSIYTIQHDSFEAAYEEFCDWQVDQLKAEDVIDPANHDWDRQSYSSNGVPIDTEAVQGCECHLVRIECA